MTRLTWLWALLVLVGMSQGPPAAARGAAATQGAAAAQAAPTAQQRTYVGQETCVGCHDTEGESIHKTAHGKAQIPGSPEADKGCESCHGPGSAHLDDPSVPDSIRRFAQIRPRDASDTCLTCHSRGNHTQWKGSMHDARNLSCITCHSVHSPKSDKSQLKAASIVDTCRRVIPRRSPSSSASATCRCARAR